jgi:hypothetical protein
MHIFIRLVILFIFVFALMMLNIPQIECDNFLKYKLYIFCGIFMFEFIIDIFLAIYKKCIIDINKIIINSLQSALIATVAYAVYNDLIWMSSPLIKGQDTILTQNLGISVIITLFMALGYFFEMIFVDITPGMNDCLNTIYPSK